VTKQESHTLIPLATFPSRVDFFHRVVVVLYGCDGRVAHVVGGFEQAGGPGGGGLGGCEKWEGWEVGEGDGGGGGGVGG